MSTFNQLTNEKRNLNLYYTQYNSFYQHNIFQARKGKDNFHVTLNDIDYKLKTKINGEKHQITKKPNKPTEDFWDNKITKYLEITKVQKDELETYRTKDLKHLRTNLFVNPELANIVETHLTATNKEIEKFEVEIMKIQNDYKRLKDEEIVIK